MAKYHEWLTKDGLDAIESYARDGLTDKQIAANIGVAERTFTNWKKQHSAINAALKKGKQPVDFEIENKLLQKARGFEYEETETYIKEVDGVQTKTVKRIKKYALPDTSAIIFWLKNRKPNQWRKLSPEVKDKLEAETRKLEAEASILQYEADKLEQSGEVNDLLKALMKVVDEDD